MAGKPVAADINTEVPGLARFVFLIRISHIKINLISNTNNWYICEKLLWQKILQYY